MSGLALLIGDFFLLIGGIVMLIGEMANVAMYGLRGKTTWTIASPTFIPATSQITFENC